MINSICRLLSRTLLGANFQPYQAARAEASACPPSPAEINPVSSGLRAAPCACSVAYTQCLLSTRRGLAPLAPRRSCHRSSAASASPPDKTRGGFFKSRFQYLRKAGAIRTYTKLPTETTIFLMR